MRYFCDAAARAASGHENYIEFQGAHTTEECWDANSLYLSEDVIQETGFEDFRVQSVEEHDLVFVDTIYPADCRNLIEDAAKRGGIILEMVNEFAPWLEAQYAAGAPYVGVVDEFERVLDRRRREREAYPIEPAFLEEVRARDKNMPIEERILTYENLLRKYNMPSCFFVLSMSKPEQETTQTDP